MRCLNLVGSATLGLPLQARGDVLVLKAGHLGVLASTTREAFAAMLSRGDAANEPELSYSYFAGIGGQVNAILGGPVVYRCDVERRADGVWLTPQASQSPDLLVAQEWSSWMYNEHSCEVTPPAEVLSAAEDQEWKRHWQLIRLVPGSSVACSVYQEGIVPNSGPTLFHPFRRVQTAKKKYAAKFLRLTAEGRLET